MSKPLEFLTRTEVAELTGLSFTTIQKRVRAGLLHPVKSTRDTRMNLYPKHEVQALIDPTRAA